MKTEISLASRVKINEDVLFQELQGEAVLLNLKSGVYLGLDIVGTRIWNLLRQHLLLQDVAMPCEQCERDLLRLVGEMNQQGLAEIGT